MDLFVALASVEEEVTMVTVLVSGVVLVVVPRPHHPWLASILYRDSKASLKRNGQTRMRSEHTLLDLTYIEDCYLLLDWSGLIVVHTTSHTPCIVLLLIICQSFYLMTLCYGHQLHHLLVLCSK